LKEQFLIIQNILFNSFNLSLEVEAGLLAKVSKFSHPPVKEFDVIHSSDIIGVYSNKLLF